MVSGYTTHKICLLHALCMLTTIVHGRVYPENLEDYPFGVGVSITLNDRIIQNCTGVIISERHVFTSMKCLYTDVAGIVGGFVRAGADIIDSDGDIHPIKKIFKHERFDVNDYRNNVAVIQVTNFFDFTTYINQIPINMDYIYEPTNIEIVGFSFSAKSSKYKIRSVASRIVPMEDCRPIYTNGGKGKFLRPETVCIQQIDTNALCQLSPGAALVRHQKLIGILSLRINSCRDAREPLLFAVVSHYSTWISKIVQPHMYNVMKRKRHG